MEQENRPVVVTNQLPKEYQPLTAWKYFWLKLLYSIPVVGFIFLIIHSFNRANYNRRSFARSYWIEFFIGIIICVIFVVFMVVTGLTLDELAY